MNTVQHGIRNYRNHEIGVKAQRSSHPLDVLSDILFDIKAENRRRDSQPQSPSRSDKRNEEDFREVLKKELAK